MVTYTLKVSEIRKETADTVTICFKQPALRKIKYKAGQYLSLIFRINGRRYIRPYSFSSSPLIDPHIEITVKRVLNGIVSNHIHDKVTIGDSIEVIEPMGDFVFEGNDNIKEIYFWGSGSGITPLISLIKDILNSSLLKVSLIYGNRNLESTIFSNTISFLLKKYPQRFKVLHFHTRLNLKEENQYILEGRINKECAFRILNKYNVLNTMHYICGPVGLKESVKEALSSMNIDPKNVFSEDFELTRNLQDFKDIYTKTIKLEFKNTEYDLEVIKGKSILQAALESGLELPYSCQTGNCSTCKATCLSGKVRMIGLTKSRADLFINEYLLCCSYPLTDNVRLAI